MNKTIWKAMLICVLLMALIGATVSSYAADIVPYADEVFAAATVSLASTKKVTYKCTTYFSQDSLSVTSCWLEQKVNGEWETVRSLTPPDTANSNAQAYTRVVSYSIGTGTFRVGAVFNASGYEITRYSNSRTF